MKKYIASPLSPENKPTPLNTARCGPNFLISGAAKCGTTSLYDYLRQHPEIFMPSQLKEPHYFCYADRTMNFKGPNNREPFINKSAITNLKTYEALFKQGTSFPLRGEASATYLYWAESASRIAAYNPEMKLIFILRHPVDRAYSAYNHLKRLDLEPLDFEKAIDAEASRTAENYGVMWRYMAAGRYADQLRPFLRIFPRNQIHILLFEDLKNDTTGSVEKILRFLGANTEVQLDLSGKSNESLIPDDKHLLHRVLAGENILKSITRSVLPKSYRGIVADTLRKVMFNKPTKLDPDLRKALYRQHFADERNELEEIIGQSLNHWDT